MLITHCISILVSVPTFLYWATLYFHAEFGAKQERQDTMFLFTQTILWALVCILISIEASGIVK